MSILVSTSTNIDDYEILIRKRGEGKYASYCPQLNIMLTGFNPEIPVHVQVYNSIGKVIYSQKVITNSFETNILKLNNSDLSLGMYYVLVQYNSNKFIRKLIVTQ